MDEVQVHFAGSDGHTLSARLEKALGTERAVALFAHCFTCSKDSRAARQISRTLAACGITTLRFDFTGLGESEGDFSDTAFSSNVADLLAAADYLREHHQAPQLLVGHSLGGTASLLAAARIDSCKAVCTIGSPAEPFHAEQLFAEHIPAIEERGEAEVNLGGRPFVLRKRFLEDLRAHTLTDSLAKLGRALLVFHSPQDEVVSIDEASKIFGAARHPKSFVTLDGADHLLRRRHDAVYVARVLSSWVDRYLPLESSSAAESTLSVSSQGGLTQSVQVRGHHLVSDEPDSVGGRDLGPTPYEYLLASLGTCTNMTLAIYARRKGIDLQSVRTSLTQQRQHAKDCTDCETKEGFVHEIDKSIVVEGDLSEEQRARLLEISERCPVHRTLRGEIAIRSRLG